MLSYKTNKNENSDKDKVENESNESNESNDPEMRFKKPWSKCDKGIKLNRILVFIKQEASRRSLTDNQEKQLKTLLLHLCENNGLNKSSDVIYNSETMQIESIKLLIFHEETKKYSIQKMAYKPKNISKSKTNIEKHLSKTR